jgi:hypothetical protein
MRTGCRKRNLTLYYMLSEVKKKRVETEVEKESKPENALEKELSRPYLLCMDCNRTRCEETSVAFLK